MMALLFRQKHSRKILKKRADREGMSSKITALEGQIIKS